MGTSISSSSDAPQNVKPPHSPTSSQDFVISSCLDRLKLYAQRPAENEDQIRTITTKLLSRIKLQEKLCKDLSNKCSINEHVNLLVSLLQHTENIVIIGNIVSILQELLERKTCRKNCMATLIECNSTDILLKLLPILTHDVYCPEHVLPALFFILSKLANKDSKLAMKVRCNGGLQSLMMITKSHIRHTLLLKYVMQILKICAGNAMNCRILSKEGIVTVLVEVLNCIGRKPTLLLKLTLETIGLLMKHASNVGKLIRSGGIPKIFFILEQWTKYDHHNRKKICKSGLIVLSHVADLRYGQKTICDAGGIRILYHFCVTLPRSHEFDKLLNLASTVLQKCLPQKNLPVNSSRGPFTFPIPSGKVYPSTIELKKHSDISETSYEESKNSTASNEDLGGDDDDDDNDTKNIEETSDSEDTEKSESSSESEQFIHSERNAWSENEIATYQKYFQESEILLPKSDSSFSSSKSPRKASLQSEDKVFQVVNKFSSSLSGSITEDFNNINLGQEIPNQSTRELIHKKFSFHTKSVGKFVKIAYPELHCDKIYQDLEPLNNKDSFVCRTRLLENLKQWMNPVEFPSVVVYDLDELLATSSINPYEILDNSDEQRVGKKDPSVHGLKFESRFESGNLRKAIQIGPNEYELILNPDINSLSHYQWFYFEVSNMDAVFPYTFHIINCEKTNSQFNFGMKPLLFSVKECLLGHEGWKRVGANICYYKNIYHRETPEQNSHGNLKCHYTLTFNVIFPHNNDVCYFAYHYPYTYTTLQTDIKLWELTYARDLILFIPQELCKSINGNSVPVLTITSKIPGRKYRPIIFLSARVHPGESNSSWVMKGTIEFLLSELPLANLLRETYVFKIIPMLNPDGVINGCHRCDLTAEDLNRCWRKPCSVLHPTIYHTKALLHYLNSNKKTPLVYCDYHGHSRKKNIFLYGCCNSQSWCNSDREKQDSRDYELLPQLLHELAPAFSIENCMFTVEKNREATARVTAWREFGIRRSYTMESSYCGCDQGVYKGMHLGIKHLQEMGVKFCEALLHLSSSSDISLSTIGKFLNNTDNSHLKWEDDSTGISDNSDDTDEDQTTSKSSV